MKKIIFLTVLLTSYIFPQQPDPYSFFPSAVGDVWEIKQENDNPHPAPFPVELIDRIIKSTSAKIILDPFMGSGTTAIAAIKNNRNYIGIDISRHYCSMAKKRIANFVEDD